MLFVDGENATIRGQQLADARGIVLTEGTHFLRNVFLWMKGEGHATRALVPWLGGVGVQDKAVRAFYYTSQFGDDDALNRTREFLWNLGFTAEVFKRSRNSKSEKAKGVDIALTKDLLSNAFLDNDDVAVIISGDADYRPVISELKRLGKIVGVMAFADAGAKVSLELRLSSDYFIPLDPFFLRGWSK